MDAKHLDREVEKHLHNNLELLVKHHGFSPLKDGLSGTSDAASNDMLHAGDSPASSASADAHGPEGAWKRNGSYYQSLEESCTSPGFPDVAAELCRRYRAPYGGDQVPSDHALVSPAARPGITGNVDILHSRVKHLNFRPVDNTAGDDSVGADIIWTLRRAKWAPPAETRASPDNSRKASDRMHGGCERSPDAVKHGDTASYRCDIGKFASRSRQQEDQNFAARGRAVLAPRIGSPVLSSTPKQQQPLDEDAERRRRLTPEPKQQPIHGRYLRLARDSRARDVNHNTDRAGEWRSAARLLGENTRIKTRGIIHSVYRPAASAVKGDRIDSKLNGSTGALDQRCFDSNNELLSTSPQPHLDSKYDNGPFSKRQSAFCHVDTCFDDRKKAAALRKKDSDLAVSHKFRCGLISQSKHIEKSLGAADNSSVRRSSTGASSASRVDAGQPPLASLNKLNRYLRQQVSEVHDSCVTDVMVGGGSTCHAGSLNASGRGASDKSIATHGLSRTTGQSPAQLSRSLPSGSRTFPSNDHLKRFSISTRVTNRTDKFQWKVKKAYSLYEGCLQTSLRFNEEVGRLNGDVEEKNTTIQRLRKKLKDVQEKQTVEAPRVRENGHHSDYLDTDSIERARHQTGSSTTSGAPYLSSPPRPLDGSPRSPLGSAARQRAKFLSEDGAGGDVSPLPHQPLTEDIQRLLSPEQNGLLHPVSGDSIFPASYAGESVALGETEEQYRADIERLRGHVTRLQAQLKDEMAMNDNLRDEMRLYERINGSASVAVQNSPLVDSNSSQTSANGHDLGLGDHLTEIRLLRQRLEESVRKNDHLREQLEKQLAQAKRGDVANIYLGETDQDRLLAIQRELDTLLRQQHQKDAVIENLQRELSRMQSEIQSKRDEIHSHRQRIVDMQSALEHAENQSQAFRSERSTLEVERDNAKKDARRLRDEVARLHDQLEENTELNKTLKLELSVLDTVGGGVTSGGGGRAPSSGGVDLTLLMEELRQLRLQLERTIENNNMLRQKLEEYGRGTHGGATDINIHHMYRNGEAERAAGYLGLRAEALYDNGRYIDHVEKFTSGHGASNRVVHAAHTPPSLTELRVRHDSELSLLTGSSHAMHRGRDVDVRPAQSPMSLMSGYMSPVSRRAGSANLFSSPPTKLGAPSLTLSRSPCPDQIDYLFEMNGQSLRPEELGTAGMRGQHMAPGGEHILPRNASPSVPSLHASQLGYMPATGHGTTDNMRYSIYDTNRPPGDHVKESSPPIPGIKSPSEEGMVSSRVGSDIRSLYAICAIDDYELLKKEIAESHVLLCSTETLLKERMKHYRHASPSQNLDYNTLRDVASSVENLKVLLREEQRLIALFWVSPLPQRDNQGNFIDSKMLKENQMLQAEVAKMSRYYAQAKKELKLANERLEAINRKKAEVGRSIIKQLTKTEEVIRKAGNNLEKAQRDDLSNH